LELKNRRNRLGLSQSKLASFLEIDLATYEKIEKGIRAIPKTKIHKFSMFRKVTDEDILIANYHNETISKVYRKLAESEGA
jgi:DNA-binding XRE family transcriptional regulator